MDSEDRIDYSMVDELAKQYNVPVYEVPVGFNYVGPQMTQTNALLGGEESRGYAYQGHVQERDSILTGLMILDLIVKTRMKLSEFWWIHCFPLFTDYLSTVWIAIIQRIGWPLRKG